MNPEKKKGRGKKAVLIVCLVVLALVVAGTLAYRRLIVKPDLPSQDQTDRPPVTETDDPTEQTGGDEIDDAGRKSADFYTILVAGVDTSSYSTDTIMLVSYDVTNQSATVMSIPRDTLVNTFGTQRYTRINSVYSAYGRGEEGMDALSREVSELVGFMPDYRVFVNWELVGKMVDAIGGVEFDVPFHMEYDDPVQDLHIYVEKGLQTLDGDTAMQVVRWRKNNIGVSSGGGTGSDLDRVRVQQEFLKAVLRQTLQIKNIMKINDLAKLFSDHVEGDLTLENLLWFAKEAIFGGLSVDDVEFVTMPWVAAGNYVYPDGTALLELINSKLNPFVTDVDPGRLDLIYVDADGNLCATGGTEN